MEKNYAKELVFSGMFVNLTALQTKKPLTRSRAFVDVLERIKIECKCAAISLNVRNKMKFQIE